FTHPPPHLPYPLSLHDALPIWDPVAASNPSLDTTQWRFAPVNQPENALLGIMFESLFDYGSSFPWVVTNASHWIYAGTGLQNGQDRKSTRLNSSHDQISYAVFC